MSTFRQALNPEVRSRFDWHLRDALVKYPDLERAEAYAREKTLYEVMKASAAIAIIRGNISERQVAPEGRRPRGYRKLMSA